MFIPIRVQVECTGTSKDDSTSGGADAAERHAFSSKGVSQMNPRNYLHLPHSKVDIRGSKIAVYFAFKDDMRKSSALAFNLYDGRW